jgi:asparagine synthase (glutamine-hydrolysing)
MFAQDRRGSDVPAAVSLSGGLDSSSVLSSLAAAQERFDTERAAPHWRRAYIAGFPGTPQDETTYATRAADHVGATPVVHRFSGHEFCEHLDSYLYQYEEIGGLQGIASWALYREMPRDGVAISLEGHGGDELLGGYGMHLLLALLSGPTIASAPRRTLDLIGTLQRMYGANHPERPGGTARLALLTFPFIRAVAKQLLPSQRTLQGSLQRHSSSTDGDEKRRPGPLTGILYHSFHRESLPRILRNFDAYSMGHGVEVRMPLLDWRVVCYAFSTPDESKVGGGYAKRLLREAMRGVLPETVRLRPDKLGYNAPITDWLNDGLADWLWDMLNDPQFLRSELWDGRALLALARTKRESGAPWTPPEMRRATTAVTTHWWLTRWLKSDFSRATSLA